MSESQDHLGITMLEKNLKRINLSKINIDEKQKPRDESQEYLGITTLERDLKR